MRTFRSYRAAKQLAEQMGWAITYKRTSDCGSFVRVKFSPAPPKSRLMAGVI